MTIHLFKGRTCIDARNPSQTERAAIDKARRIVALDFQVLGKRTTVLVVDTTTQQVLATIEGGPS